MLKHKPFSVLCIHDCFRCLPGYANWLRMHVISIYGQIADSNLIGSIASQILCRTVNVAKLDNDLGDMVRNSEYIIS